MKTPSPDKQFREAPAREELLDWDSIDTVLLDMEGTVSKTYNVRSHPVKYLINRQGELVSVSLGYQDWASDKVKAKIDILMADLN